MPVYFWTAKICCRDNQVTRMIWWFLASLVVTIVKPSGLIASEFPDRGRRPIRRSTRPLCWFDLDGAWGENPIIKTYRGRHAE